MAAPLGMDPTRLRVRHRNGCAGVLWGGFSTCNGFVTRLGGFCTLVGGPIKIGRRLKTRPTTARRVLRTGTLGFGPFRERIAPASLPRRA
jgi:hypothetical protein